MFNFDNIGSPNIVIQTPVSAAPFGNATSAGQINFADGSNGVDFGNVLGVGQMDGWF